MSSMSWGVTARSSACRRAATWRLNGLPGPPLFPWAKRPLLSRPGWGCCWGSAVVVWVAVVMADTPERILYLIVRTLIGHSTTGEGVGASELLCPVDD